MKNQIRRFDRSGSFFPTFFNFVNDDVFNPFVNGDLPATNVSENEKAFSIELSVPGFNKEDIKIEIEKEILRISAESKVENEEKDDNNKILRREFKQSSFIRSFTIPENIDTENISASQVNGILQITLPKQMKTIEDKVKKIAIS
ncbi:Hsp20/alpha crystallin family protein [Dysgonomonas sp. Marseille-P4677]|uniref:Hsp20/alpha crystallin family protein n=1 Tax=Dysgonomonas sp. Marseille-P4677 TaxID=2364790 RepID=UPI00191140D1|nr:Hsp20/alpha crystallin family protein [Dysgonomonas sp. Marseille-P4677]MBK5720907.1 Hsp20/alpha crystallin family protein [Dysgonomonas sp. Marseille-P4677]